MRKFAVALLAIPVASFGLMAMGCNSNNDVIKEDPSLTKKRVESATEMRSYFDKSNGNYDSLSPEDQAKLNALTGGEKKSREAFGHMVPAGGTPPSSAGH